MSVSLEERGRGALLGMAVGDALGAPLVGMGRDQARIKHGVVDRYLGGGLYLLAPGENTARLALVRAAAVALMDEEPGEERFLDAYLQVLASRSRDMGEASRASLERIRDGTTPADAAREAHEALERRSAGIGAALRAVPFALRYHGEPGLLAEGVLADAARTHHDPRAQAAALALAFWVAEHLGGEDDAAAAFDRAAEAMASRPELPDVMPTRAAIREVAVRATAYAPDVLHAAARHTLGAASAGEAIVGAINEAGEASALGAVVGALVGARSGAEALPSTWVDLLQGAAAWRNLADGLLAQR